MKSRIALGSQVLRIHPPTDKKCFSHQIFCQSNFFVRLLIGQKNYKTKKMVPHTFTRWQPPNRRSAHRGVQPLIGFRSNSTLVDRQSFHLRERKRIGSLGA